jgi:hypothetical protein
MLPQHFTWFLNQQQATTTHSLIKGESQAHNTGLYMPPSPAFHQTLKLLHWNV